MLTFDQFSYIIMDIIRHQALEIFKIFYMCFFRILDLEENQALLILITNFILISRLKNQEEVRAKKEAKILAMAMEQKARAQVIRCHGCHSCQCCQCCCCCFGVVMLLFLFCCCCCCDLLRLFFGAGHMVFLQVKILVRP